MGEWSEALSELRAARRMAGGPGHVAILADCERALGRPERAIELSRSPEAAQLEGADAVELRIVAAGARRDLGEIEASVVSLQIPELDPQRQEPWSARLFYAYADNLLAAERTQEAFTWFVHAAHADDEGETDAPERLDELVVLLGGPEMIEDLVNEAEAQESVVEESELDESGADDSGVEPAEVETSATAEAESEPAEVDELTGPHDTTLLDTDVERGMQVTESSAVDEDDEAAVDQADADEVVDADERNAPAGAEELVEASDAEADGNASADEGKIITEGEVAADGDTIADGQETAAAEVAAESAVAARQSEQPPEAPATAESAVPQATESEKRDRTPGDVEAP
ncbi:hypothetical protein [Saccharopolyspora erythraea]|uniref:hypothetical protein n=1 Tax=Saccharopolyspora erythraea TaxID=1836 RepID=UPI0001D311C3|nr:hypothetical protein [Saccharopolyspora erythraea]